MSYAGDITPQQSWTLLAENPEAVLVDCRTESEWRWVGVPDLSGLGRDVVFVQWHDNAGQRNSSFVADLAAAGITGNQPVVFLCRSGGRSLAAAQEATAAGISPSYNMIDGFEGQVGADGHRGHSGWRASGLPWKQS